MTSLPSGSQSQVALGDYLEVLRRRRWVILQTFALIAGVGAVATLLSPPVYRGTAKLQVEASYTQVNMVSADNPLVALLALAQPPSIQTQLQVLQSRPFLQEVLAKAGAAKAKPVVRVRSIPDTRVIEVICESASAEQAAAVPNLMLGEHVRATDLLSSKGVVDARRFVEREARQAQQTLAETETRLIEFRQRNRIVASSGPEHAVQEISHLDAAARETGNRIALLRAQRAALEGATARLPAERVHRQVGANPRLEPLKARIADLEVARATAVLEFKPAHPRVMALETQLAALKKQLEAEPAESVSITRTTNPELAVNRSRLEQLDAELRGLEAQQRLQAAQLEAKRSEYVRRGALLVQLAQLERARGAAEKSYQLLTDKLQDLRIREKAQRSTARIIEPAIVPATPVRPRKAMNLVLACTVGLCLGVSMAFLQEFLDDRVNSLEDVERFVGLPVLGYIPSFPHADQRLIARLPSQSPITESYRRLRTSISFSALDEPVRTLLVSSAHPGEGKSHTAVNLAIALALDGRRVILVDTDLRRPSIHHLLDLPPSPGLSEVLIGERTLGEALRPTEVAGLRAVPSGALPPNPAELLNSAAMARLIELLRGEADCVIFDTPPCVPVTDATVLSGKVDGVLLVVMMGEARKAAVALARAHLTQARARLLGLVLNRIDQAGVAGSYYYEYRRRPFGAADGVQVFGCSGVQERRTTNDERSTNTSRTPEHLNT